MRQFAYGILAYAIAELIVIPLNAIQRGVPASADELLICIAVMIAGVLALQMELAAIEQNSQLTNDPNRANWW